MFLESQAPGFRVEVPGLSLLGSLTLWAVEDLKLRLTLVNDFRHAFPKPLNPKLGLATLTSWRPARSLSELVEHRSLSCPLREKKCRLCWAATKEFYVTIWWA